MLNGSFSRHGQILIASLTLGALAMIAATGWYYLRQRAAIEAGMTQELAAIAEIKVKQISNWRRERLGDGRVLESSALTRIAGRLLSGRDVQPTDRADLLDTMQKLEREFLYTGAALVDRNGNICLESNPGPSDPSRVAELGKAATLQTDVKLQDLYWDAKLARPLMALSVPVQGSGAFILTIDPDRFLYPFISSWPVPRATAETVLVRREGGKTLYLSDLRHKPGTAFRFWRPIRVASRAEIETKFGWVFKQPDYRGVTVLGTVRSIPDSPWYLIAKIDVSEVDAPVWRLGWGMALIVALIALANMAGVGFIWRDRQLRIHREREAWFQQVANETPAYLWMTSAHGENSFINEPLAQFVGGRKQTPHKNWKACFHPDEAGRVFNKFFDCVAARAEFLDEHQLRRFDGEYRWFIDQGRPRFSSQGEFLGYAGSLFDITERKDAERSARQSAELIHGQNRVLGLIAQNASLQETLDLLVRVIEALSPDMLGSILLLDSDGLHVRHCAAPSLPEAYIRAIDGAPIGAAAGSCGTAAFRRQPVVVEDVATDPLWENYRKLALDNGLRACWSTPIFEEQREQRHLLGTFALYFRSPRLPTPRHRELVAMATQTAAIAIVKNRETEALHAANAALAQELQERTRTEREIRALSARLIHAQEEERTRLARELHDDLSQQIAALSIGLSNLKRVIPLELADARDQSERIREKLVRLAENIRRLSHELHPAILQHCGLDITLRAYCSEFGALAGIGVAFHSDGSFDRVPPAIALCAYRIAQEGLQNVMKHARTDRAELALAHFDGTLRLTVSDYGIGMNLNGAGRARGLGLISIKERTRLVNGTLHIESQPNQGTILAVTLPVPG